MSMTKDWAVLAACLSAFLVSPAVRAAPESATKTITCKVKGMTCGGCATMIEGSLLKTSGVKTAKVSFKNSEAVVEIDPAQAGERDVVAAIDKAGFKASVVSDPDGAALVRGLPASAPLIARRQARLEAIPPERVTFYQVDLVCPAAPKIACGSRAKPVLLGLVADSRVEGAWLNEAGTRVAIAWKDAGRMMTVEQLNELLAEKGLSARELGGESRKALVQSLRGSGWYDAESVDKLSAQEAGIIAERLVKRLAARTTVTVDQQRQLRGAIETVFHDRFGKKREGDIQEQLLSAVEPHLSPEALAAFREVLSLGYRPLAKEE